MGHGDGVVSRMTKGGHVVELLAALIWVPSPKAEDDDDDDGVVGGGRGCGG